MSEKTPPAPLPEPQAWWTRLAVPGWVYPIVLGVGGAGLGVGGMSIAVTDRNGRDLVAVSAPEMQGHTAPGLEAGGFDSCTFLAAESKRLEAELVALKVELEEHEESYETMVVRLATCLLELPDDVHPDP
jgi:hypothetical protein